MNRRKEKLIEMLPAVIKTNNGLILSTELDKYKTIERLKRKKSSREKDNKKKTAFPMKYYENEKLITMMPAILKDPVTTRYKTQRSSENRQTLLGKRRLRPRRTSLLSPLLQPPSIGVFS